MNMVEERKKSSKSGHQLASGSRRFFTRPPHAAYFSRARQKQTKIKALRREIDQIVYRLHGSTATFLQMWRKISGEVHLHQACHLCKYQVEFRIA